MQKMEIINKSINSKAVQNMRLNEMDVWSLFFDSGCDYLDQLQHRITRYSVFKAQFGELMSGISLKQTPNETFKRILASPHFWNWWSTQLWRVCYNYSNDGKNEVYIRLMFNTSLIPQSTLEKIFKNERRQTNSAKQKGMPFGIKHRTQQVC
jgi:hypothetical protein